MNHVEEQRAFRPFALPLKALAAHENFPRRLRLLLNFALGAGYTFEVAMLQHKHLSFQVKHGAREVVRVHGMEVQMCDHTLHSGQLFIHLHKACVRQEPASFHVLRLRPILEVILRYRHHRRCLHSVIRHLRLPLGNTLSQPLHSLVRLASRTRQPFAMLVLRRSRYPLQLLQLRRQTVILVLLRLHW